MAQTYNNLGLICARKGEWDRAVEFYERDLEISGLVGDRHGMARTWGNLGAVYLRKGDWGRAVELYRRSLEVLEQLGDVRGVAQTYNNLGLAYVRKGDLDQAITDFDSTALGKYASLNVELNEGLSGFYPLEKGLDALGMRLRLAEIAEKSLDLQYFLMKNDTAGAVMANALIKAADRGVRVRFLLDDIFTTVPDDSFLLINQHPNIEIRIFNPIARSGASTLNFVWHFKQANRRMHNKSFTADNVVSIVGSRNIADEYFQLKSGSVLIDFDIVAVGPVVSEISNSFDEYWNHSRAVPIEQFIDDRQSDDLETVRQEIAEELDEIYDTVYEKAYNSQLMQNFVNGSQPLYAAPARVLADSPDKLVNEVNETHMRLIIDLADITRQAETEVVFISPYYIPREAGVRFARELVEKNAACFRSFDIMTTEIANIEPSVTARINPLIIVM